MENKELPNLFVIGAMKSGTTSLHIYLDKHPQIFMSKIKEINFFIEEENFSKGLDWYKNHFDSRFRFKGESSQNYTKRHLYKGVPERINDTIGEEARFIYIVRDPIKRLVSHINEAKFLGNRSNSFNLESYTINQLRELNYVLTSKYYFQLEPYLAFFPIENFHFVCFEELIAEPEMALNKVFRFLNLQEMQKGNLINLKAANVSKDKNVESEWLRNLKNGSLLPNSVKRFISPLVKNKFKKLIEASGFGKTEINQVVLSSDLRMRIEKVLKEDIAQFRDITGQNFNRWSI